ncbi:MAG: hypothetical protein DCC55_36595 [Chloroflexi bacterium]|nr:MAG: hypothetical protein DCC55_36595 [Chloroflexota bacterium]
MQTVVAAMSVGVPTYRFSADRFDELADLVIRSARQLSHMVGWPSTLLIFLHHHFQSSIGGRTNEEARLFSMAGNPLSGAGRLWWRWRCARARPTGATRTAGCRGSRRRGGPCRRSR